MVGDSIYAVTSDIDASLEAEFNAWYDAEHVVELLAVPGFLAARRFRAIDGSPKYLAVYDLEQPEVLNTYAFQRIRPTHPDSTPDCKRMWSHVKNWKRAAYAEEFANGTAAKDAGQRAGFLFLAGFDFDASVDEEYQRWFRTEHLPAVTRIAGVERTRSFRIDPTMLDHVLGGPPRHIVLYDLAHIQVCDGAAWRHAMEAPDAARLRRLSSSPMRNLYQRVFPL